jgi:hypothetical protein
MITSSLCSNFKTYGYNNYFIFTFVDLEFQQIGQYCLEFFYNFNILPLELPKNFNVSILYKFTSNLTMMYKFKHVNTKCSKKWNGRCAFQQCFQFTKCLPLLHNFNLKKIWKIVKIVKKMKNNKNNKRNNLRPKLTSWFFKPWAFILTSFSSLDQLNFITKWSYKWHVKLT